jgi:hypothetical protein
MDEVMDPSLVIYGEGLLGGLTLYILYIILYAFYNEKNIVVFNISQVHKTNQISRFTIKNYKFSLNTRSFHTKVKAYRRIGPHNEDVISLLVGSLLGDAYGNRRS